MNEKIYYSIKDYLSEINVKADEHPIIKIVNQYFKKNYDMHECDYIVQLKLSLLWIFFIEKIFSKNYDKKLNRTINVDILKNINHRLLPLKRNLYRQWKNNQFVYLCCKYMEELKKPAIKSAFYPKNGRPRKTKKTLPVFADLKILLMLDYQFYNPSLEKEFLQAIGLKKDEIAIDNK